MLFNQLIARWYVFNSCSLFFLGSVQSSQSVSDFLVVLRVLRLVKIMRQIKRLVQLHHGALSTQPGAIIGDGDSKRAPFLVFPPWLRPSLSYETFFSIFRKKIAPPRLRHTRVHALRMFADVAQGKWRPKFPKSFMLLAHNSTSLRLLEFCLSIFVLSCSSLSEIRRCRIY